MPDSKNTSDVTALTVQLLSVYLTNNPVASQDFADLVRSTRAALSEDLTQPPADSSSNSSGSNVPVAEGGLGLGTGRRKRAAADSTPNAPAGRRKAKAAAPTKSSRKSSKPGAATPSSEVGIVAGAVTPPTAQSAPTASAGTLNEDPSAKPIATEPKRAQAAKGKSAKPRGAKLPKKSPRKAGAPADATAPSRPETATEDAAPPAAQQQSTTKAGKPPASAAARKAVSAEQPAASSVETVASEPAPITQRGTRAKPQAAQAKPRREAAPTVTATLTEEPQTAKPSRRGKLSLFKDKSAEKRGDSPPAANEMPDVGGAPDAEMTAPRKAPKAKRMARTPAAS